MVCGWLATATAPATGYHLLAARAPAERQYLSPPARLTRRWSRGSRGNHR